MTNPRRRPSRKTTLPQVDPRPCPKCIDIRKRFGDRFRVAYEQSSQAEKSRPFAVDAIWLQVIPGRLGDVGPWDEDRLLAHTYRAGKAASLLRRLPFAEVHVDGDDGVSVIFPVEKLAEVVSILKLRRRRRLSPKAGQRLAEVGVKTRFQAGTRVDSKASPRAAGRRSDSRAVRRRRTPLASKKRT